MERLPTEIIREICGALCSHCRERPDMADLYADANWRLSQMECDRKVLANLCLTSSKLRAIAQPFIYHRIYITDRRIFRSIPLLNTLASRPDLAQAVRYLTLSELGGGENTVDDEVLSRLTQVARQAGLSLPDDWARDFELLPDYLMQQIAVQVPHIEVLALLSVSSFDWVPLSSVDPVARSLPTLRKVVLDYYDTEYGYDLSTLNSLFSLSTSIKTLIAYKCAGVSDRLSLQNVTRLVLRACCISRQDMNNVLSSCGKLDTFSYDGDLAVVGQGIDGISANELVRMLEEQGHSRTLQRFGLDYSYDLYREPAIIQSLVGFSQLQALWLGSVFIRWPEVMSANAVLPPSLEAIGFHSRPEDTASALNWLAAQISVGFFSNLKKIEVFSDNGNMEENEIEGDWGRRFKALDIAFSISNVPLIGGWE